MYDFLYYRRSSPVSTSVCASAVAVTSPRSTPSARPFPRLWLPSIRNVSILLDWSVY